MSDDENKIDADGKQTGKFLAWAPLYHMDEVSICLHTWFVISKLT